MQTFISSEKKTKPRKGRGEISQQQIKEFLNRPVKKPEDLNHSLRKSYQRNFFNGQRFEHFKILKSKRKNKDLDSVTSYENEDDDYRCTLVRKTSSARPQPTKRQRKEEKQTIKKEQQQLRQKKDQMKREESRRMPSPTSSDSTESIPSSKANKKSAKVPQRRPPPSSSSSDSNTSEPTSQQSCESSSKQAFVSVNTIEMYEKLDSATKDEPEQPKLESKAAPEESMSESSSQLSDKPAPSLLRKAKTVRFIDEQQTFKQEQPQPHLTSILKESSVFASEQSKQKEQHKLDISIADKDSSIVLECPQPSQPKRRTPQLKMQSRVFVESIYLCTNHSKLEAFMDLKRQWEALNSMFLHAPCCPYQQPTSRHRLIKPECEKEQATTEVKPDPSLSKQAESPDVEVSSPRTTFRRKMRVKREVECKQP